MRRRTIETERLFNRPWLISHTALKALVASHKAAAPFVDDNEDDAEDRDFAMTDDGIACIPIAGVLTKDPYWGTTSYGEIAEMCSAAMADDSVKAILLTVDSPGGEVGNMFDLADALYSARSQKPMAAIADDQCYSAAYCLASSAERLFVTRTGGTGSVGAFTAHVDYSKMLHDQGINVTYVASGARKIDGNPTQPLSDAARSDLQTEVDRLRSMFAQTVARNRNVPEDALMDTEAACYMSADGIPLLCDEVGTVADAVAYLRTRVQSGDTRGLSRNRRRYVSGTFAALAEPQQRVLAGPQFSGAQRLEPILATRVFPGIRASVDNKPGSRTISMLCAPYNSAADFGSFKEVYSPGCFSKGLDGDLRVLFAHNEEHVLGRTSSGSCRFWEDSAGVHVTVDPPNAQWAEDLLASVRRGDVNQASSAFYILSDRWEMRGSERFRVIERARMREASVVAFAAYAGTEAIAGGQAALPAAASHAETDLARCRRELAAFAPLTDLDRARLEIARLR